MAINALAYMRKKTARYIKNVGKSIGYVAIDDVTPYSGAIQQLYRDSKELSRNLRASADARRLNAIKSRARTTTLEKTALAAARSNKSSFSKNLVSDIRSGKLYNKERMNRSISDNFDFGLDANNYTGVSFNFGDDDFGDYETAGTANKEAVSSASTITRAFDQIGMNMNVANAEAFSRSAEFIANSHMEASKAIFDGMNVGFGNVMLGLNAINTNIMIIQQGLGNDIKSLTLNASKHYIDTDKYQKESLELLRSIAKNTEMIQKSTAPAPHTGVRGANKGYDLQSILKYSGVLDMKALRTQMKKGFNENFLTPLLIQLGLGGDSGGSGASLASNPIGLILPQVLSYLGINVVPRNIKRRINSANAALRNFAGNAVGRAKRIDFAKALRGGPLEILGGFMNDIRDAILPKSNYRDKINTGNYNKGKVDWDGISRKSLVEVIPTQLGKILSAITGKPEMRYDFDKGRWVSVKSVMQEHRKAVNKEKLYAADQFYGYADAIIQNSSNLSDRERKLMRGMVKNVSIRAYDNNDSNNPDLDYMKLINPEYKNARDPEVVRIAKNYGIKPNEIQSFRNLMWAMYKSDIGRGAINGLRNSITISRDNYGRQMNYKESLNDSMINMIYDGSVNFGKPSPTTYLGHKSSIAKTKASAIGSRRNLNSYKNKNKGIMSSVDEYNNDIFFYLQGIYQYTQHISNNLPLLISGAGQGQYQNVIEIQGASIPKNNNNGTSPIKPSKYRPRSPKGQANFRTTNRDLGFQEESARAVADANFDVAMSPELREYANVRKAYEDNGRLDYFKNSADYKQYERQYQNAINGKDISSGLVSKLQNGGKFAKYIYGILEASEKNVIGILEDVEKGINSINSNIGLQGSGSIIAKTVSDSMKDIFSRIGDTLTSFIPGWLKDIGKQIFSNIRNSEFGKAVSGSLRSALGFFNPFVETTRNRASSAARTVINEIAPGLNTNAAGGRRVTKTGIVAVSEGEMIIPSEMNPFYNGVTNKAQQIRDENRAVQQYFGNYAKGGTIEDPIMKSLFELYKKQGMAPKEAYKAASSKIRGVKRGATGAVEKVSQTKAGQAVNGMLTNIGAGILSFMSPRSEKEIEDEKKKISNLIAGALDDMGISKGAVGAGALIGGGVSLLTGAVVGPLAGAAIGAASGLIIKSEKVQNALFGEEVKDEDGNKSRKGGLLSKKITDFMTKNVPSMTKGAGLGAAAGLILGSPVLGAIVGGAAGFASSSDKVKNFIFGNLDENGKRKGGMIPKKVQDAVKKAALPIAGGAALGLLAGPFGLAGNLLFGSALGFATSTNKFKDWFFGPEDKNGKRKGGKYGAFMDKIKAELFDPISTSFKNLTAIATQSVKNLTKSLSSTFRKFLLKHVMPALFKTRLGKWIVGGAKGLAKGALGLLTLPGKALARGTTNYALRHGITLDDMTSASRLKYRSDNVNIANRLMGPGQGKRMAMESVLAGFSDNDDRTAMAEALEGYQNADKTEFNNIMVRRKNISTIIRKMYKDAGLKVPDAKRLNELNDELAKGTMNLEDLRETIRQETYNRLDEGQLNEIARGLEENTKSIMTSNENIKSEYSTQKQKLIDLVNKSNTSPDEKKRLIDRIDSGKLSTTDIEYMKGQLKIDADHTFKVNEQNQAQNTAKLTQNSDKQITILDKIKDIADNIYKLLNKDKPNENPIEEAMEEPRLIGLGGKRPANDKLSQEVQRRAKGGFVRRGLAAVSKGELILPRNFFGRFTEGGPIGESDTTVDQYGNSVESLEGSRGYKNRKRKGNFFAAIGAIPTGFATMNNTLQEIKEVLKGSESGEKKKGIFDYIKDIFMGGGLSKIISTGISIAAPVLAGLFATKLLANIWKGKGDKMGAMLGYGQADHAGTTLVDSEGQYVHEDPTTGAYVREDGSPAVGSLKAVDSNVTDPLSDKMKYNIGRGLLTGKGTIIGGAARFIAKKMPGASLIAKGAKGIGNKIGGAISKKLGRSAVDLESGLDVLEMAKNGAEAAEKSSILLKLSNSLRTFGTKLKGIPLLGKFTQYIDDISEGILDYIQKNSLKSGAAALKSGLKTAAFVLNVIFIVGDVVTGWEDAGKILGVKKPTAAQRFVCSFARALIRAIPFVGTLLPDKSLIKVICGIMSKFGVPGFKDLDKQQNELQEEVDDYNDANGTNLTVEEYQAEVLNDINIFDKAKNKVKGAFANVKNFFKGNKASNAVSTETSGSGSFMGSYAEGGVVGAGQTSILGETADNIKNRLSTTVRKIHDDVDKGDIVKLLKDTGKVGLGVATGSIIPSIIGPAITNTIINKVTGTTGGKKGGKFANAISKAFTLVDKLIGYVKEGDINSIDAVEIDTENTMFKNIFKVAKGIFKIAALFGGIFKKVGDVINNAKDKAKNIPIFGKLIEFLEGDSEGTNNSGSSATSGSGSGFISQYDRRYKNMRLGGKTIADNGCAPATALMAINQMKMSGGSSMNSAVNLANKYQTSGGTDASYFADEFRRNGYRANYMGNRKQMLANIAAGRPTILLGNTSGGSSKAFTPFGPNNHYVVANGMDSRGNIIVSDPEQRSMRAYSPYILNQAKLGISGGASGTSTMRYVKYWIDPYTHKRYNNTYVNSMNSTDTFKSTLVPVMGDRIVGSEGPTTLYGNDVYADYDYKAFHLYDDEKREALLNRNLKAARKKAANAKATAEYDALYANSLAEYNTGLSDYNQNTFHLYDDEKRKALWNRNLKAARKRAVNAKATAEYDELYANSLAESKLSNYDDIMFGYSREVAAKKAEKKAAKKAAKEKKNKELQRYREKYGGPTTINDIYGNSWISDYEKNAFGVDKTTVKQSTSEAAIERSLANARKKYNNQKATAEYDALYANSLAEYNTGLSNHENTMLGGVESPAPKTKTMYVDANGFGYTQKQYDKMSDERKSQLTLYSGNTTSSASYDPVEKSLNAARSKAAVNRSLENARAKAARQSTAATAANAIANNNAIDPGDKAIINASTGEKTLQSEADKMAAKYADNIKTGGFKINKDDANSATAAINSVFDSNGYSNMGDPGETNGVDGPGTTIGSSNEKTKGKYEGMGILNSIIQIFSDAFGRIFGMNVDSDSESTTNTGDSMLSVGGELINGTDPVGYMESIKGQLVYSQSSRNPENGSGDCSSTVQWAFKKATGIDIGGNTGTQVRNTAVLDVVTEKPVSSWFTLSEIPFDQLRRNDILFFNHGKGVVKHVGIYIGNKQYIHHGGGKNGNTKGPTIAYLNGSKAQGLFKVMRLRGYVFESKYAGTSNNAGTIARTPTASISNINEAYKILNSLGLSDKKKSFIKQILPDVLAEANKRGIYPSLVLAQAGLESEWGTSNLARNHNNLFGVRPSKSTNEYWSGEVHNTKSNGQFKHYSSWSNSVADHARLIGTSDNYTGMRKSNAANYVEAAAALEASPYCYPPGGGYGNKVLNQINTDRLYEFDAFNPAAETIANAPTGMAASGSGIYRMMDNYITRSGMGSGNYITPEDVKFVGSGSIPRAHSRAINVPRYSGGASGTPANTMRYNSTSTIPDNKKPMLTDSPMEQMVLLLNEIKGLLTLKDSSESGDNNKSAMAALYDAITEDTEETTTQSAPSGRGSNYISAPSKSNQEIYSSLSELKNSVSQILA